MYWRKIWWGLIVIVVEIFGSVGRHWSQNIAMNPLLPPNPLFTMECLANILSGDLKAGVQSIKSYDGEVDTELTRQNMQKCITLTKKIQKEARALQ